MTMMIIEVAVYAPQPTRFTLICLTDELNSASLMSGSVAYHIIILLEFVYILYNFQFVHNFLVSFNVLCIIFWSIVGEKISTSHGGTLWWFYFDGCLEVGLWFTHRTHHETLSEFIVTTKKSATERRSQTETTTIALLGILFQHLGLCCATVLSFKVHVD